MRVSQRLMQLVEDIESKPFVTAGMATYKGRDSSTTLKAVQSIAPQVDELNIYFNDYDEVPNWVNKFDNVIAYLGKNEQGDLKARGMFRGVSKRKGIHTFVGDDLVYPPNYVKDMIGWLNRFEGKVIVTCHSHDIDSFPIKTYLGSKTTNLHSVNRIGKPRQVPFAGTGGAFIDTSKVTINFSFARDKRFDKMVDPPFGVSAMKARVPIMVVPTKWSVKNIEGTQKEALHKVNRDKDPAVDYINSALSQKDWFTNWR